MEVEVAEEYMVQLAAHRLRIRKDFHMAELVGAVMEDTAVKQLLMPLPIVAEAEVVEDILAQLEVQAVQDELL